MKKTYKSPKIDIVVCDSDSLLTASFVQTMGTEGEAAEVRQRGSWETEAIDPTMLHEIQTNESSAYGSLWAH